MSGTVVQRPGKNIVYATGINNRQSFNRSIATAILMFFYLTPQHTAARKQIHYGHMSYHSHTVCVFAVVIKRMQWL